MEGDLSVSWGNALSLLVFSIRRNTGVWRLYVGIRNRQAWSLSGNWGTEEASCFLFGRLFAIVSYRPKEKKRGDKLYKDESVVPTINLSERENDDFRSDPTLRIRPL